jgi:hypothetical protein
MPKVTKPLKKSIDKDARIRELEQELRVKEREYEQ